MAECAKHYGFACERLDRAGITALEPLVGARYQVGVYLADHGTIVNPLGTCRRSCVRSLRAAARLRARRGARPGASVRTARGTSAIGESARHYDHVVVAAGAWSRALLDPLGIRLPLESQRGYHVQFADAAPISRTVVLADRKVFATPMESGLRVGGTVEIAGLDAPPDPRRRGDPAPSRDRHLSGPSRRAGDDMDGTSALHAGLGADHRDGCEPPGPPPRRRPRPSWRNRLAADGGTHRRRDRAANIVAMT